MFLERREIAAVAVVEFRIMIGRIPQERDPRPPLRDQVPRRLRTARDIVAPDGQPGLVVPHRSPADEMRPLRHEVIEPRSIIRIIAIAEQDQPVGAVAVLVIGMPVGREILERNEQVIAMIGTRPHHRAQHAQEERIDLGLVGRRIAEQQQRDRPRLAAAQVRCTAVDGIVQLLGDRLDPLPRRRADRRAATQRARHGRLRYARGLRDVERRGFALGTQDRDPLGGARTASPSQSSLQFARNVNALAPAIRGKSATRPERPH